MEPITVLRSGMKLVCPAQPGLHSLLLFCHKGRVLRLYELDECLFREDRAPHTQVDRIGLFSLGFCILGMGFRSILVPAKGHLRIRWRDKNKAARFHRPLKHLRFSWNSLIP